MQATIALSLDLKGLSCPLPIAKTARAMKGLDPGSVIEVFATDPGSVPDFNAWSKATGNPLLEQTVEAGVYRFLLKKKEV
jgi:tRNA 2-thiouridine synthesizing protein A